ncbi:hypothetical protein B0H13DRAFT_2031337 [Mycena leptocephala]|nr:hypothetical protein B0H13DRAFT_2031337 [Mycena leptocephala]
MSSETTARVSSNPLRRRIHILERASRSFTTADSNDEDMQSLPSPPTSFEAGDDEDDEEDRVPSGDDGIGGPSQPTVPLTEVYEEEETYHTPAPRPWYKPSIPVLLAIAPPIGNWLTGGDHLKDLLLLLLLIFYLHQLVEVPWGLYHSARPRRSPSPNISSAPTLTTVRAKSELRILEISLLLFCLVTPALGVILLRSLGSFTNPGSPTEPISCTLHALVHTHAAPTLDPHVADLRAQLAHLEATVAQLVQREEALYAYKGVRRVERRVGKLRNAKKELAAAGATTHTNTIFVPAPAKPSPQSLIASWFASPAPAAPTAVYAPPPISPTSGNGKTRRLALDSIPEEGEPGSSQTPVFVYPPASAQWAPPKKPAAAPPTAPPAVFALLAALVRQWLAAGMALMLYPLYLVLLPVRGTLRFLVGVV